VDREPLTIQYFYAKVLDRAARLGFLLVSLGLAVYLTRLLPPIIPLEDLPCYWGLPAPRYRLALGVPGGWAWFGELHHGDFLIYLPLTFLAAVTILSYMTLLPRFFRNREPLLGVLALFQVAVLLLAASGILLMGGH